MYTFGIDIGSTTSKCVVLKDGTEIVSSSLFVGGIGTKSPFLAREEALKKAGITDKDISGTAATGYGRNRTEDADFNVSELSCHALGAHFIFPRVRTIIDIGGQDAKVISLSGDGKMRDFLMNDKCAAGTGRFLDVMAAILQVPVNEMEGMAQKAQKISQISSTCTVFAESEVISQLANGVEMPDLIAGICDSVAGRVASLAKRITIVPEVCMSGGVARNGGVRLAMERYLGTEIRFSEQAQLFGAIGAALYAFQKS
ncbi:2-hydroxyglutaryl-CoA dehydratase [Oribacterium sp. C9]|uniref:acyl-CoA dehydratase activase n=1 Tax=Oribacterium sp. C9 TaxID=1943579 RepID=UPI0009900D95|nr:acyl-CoA dehydratase activase [Oribacterium sp. C9]OON86704.1 2-hydroxyglutaryl-CoA dehydratase [Oribacterium sp. C9]